MKQTDKNVLDISQLSHSEALEAQRIQREYEERTVWRKDIILTWAKAISLTVLAIAASVALVCVANHAQNADSLEKIIEVIACVLSFLAGRAKHR